MPCNTVPIGSNKEISPGVWRLEAPFSGDIRAGQFFMLKCPEGAALLPRAISVCDYDGETVTFLYQVVGRGTGELSRLQAGDKLTLTGPLGNGFPVEELQGKIALVGGGIGVAPMVYTAKVLRQMGKDVHALCGYRDVPFYADELEQAAGALDIATETGNHGAKGFVTGILEPSRYDAVLCCGPEPMMKAVTGQCMAAGTPVYVSLENKMACGIGACLVCTCADKDGKNRRTCKDGPVFRGEEIDFA
ncbi:dihydroorotate dehydrogenase electron transfer subunit [Ruminococcaceae bacterium OttesenSCG-928-L11]|nr:dihydroorotate dehydrogenase electron transfer subunit [Ruminococcaceae bacterium OttesenSCG-928-L11]